jgi:hypothetical protein
MQQKVELNKIRSFNEIIDDSLLFFKQNLKPLFKTYFVICGFFWAAGLIVSIFSQVHAYTLEAEGASTFDVTFFIAIFFEVINFTAVTVTVLSFMAAYRDKDRETPTVEEVWGYVKFYFLRTFTGVVLLGIGLAIATACCLFPGVYLWPVFSLILTIMVIENTTFGYAFNHAFRLIKDNWGYVFGIMIVTGLLVAAAMILFIIPVMIIATVVVFLNGKHAEHVYPVAFTIGMHLIQFIYLFPFIVHTLIYYNLTEQKEDHSLLQRIQMLGTHMPQADKPTTEDEY